MAQSGYTPILIYASGTTGNTPSAANLTSSASGAELALNYFDGKLFYKDASGNVQVLASKSAAGATISFGTTGLTPSTATPLGNVTVSGTLITSNGGTGLSSYTAGDLPYYASGTALSKLGIGTNGQILTSTGTAPQWTTLSGVAVTTFSAGTTGLTPSSATSGAITLAGTLNVANGGTGLNSLTAGYIPYGNGTSAFSSSSNLYFSGTQLGIGTTSPGAILDIVQSTNGTSNIRITNANSGSSTSAGLNVVNNAYSGQFTIAGGSYGGYGAWQANETMAYGSTNLVLMADSGSGIIKFATGGNGEKMRIASNGHVSINTTADAGQLTVSATGTTQQAGTFASAGASYFNLALSCGLGNVNMYLASASTTDESLRFINSGGSEVLRIQKTGGITFNNSSALTNSTLNDYETGTWTPTFAGSGSNPTVTYGGQYGYYTKIGNLVYLTFRIIASTYSGGSGQLFIKGMPFAVSSQSNDFGTMSLGYPNNWSTSPPTYGRYTGGNNFMELYYLSGASEQSVLVGQASSGTQLIMSVVYQASF